MKQSSEFQQQQKTQDKATEANIHSSCSEGATVVTAVMF